MIPENKEFQAIFIGVLMAALGGVASFLQNHEGKDLTPLQSIKAILSKLVIVIFLGVVVSLLCSSLQLGLKESCVMASMSGFYHKEALELLKKWFEKRIPQ